MGIARRNPPLQGVGFALPLTPPTRGTLSPLTPVLTLAARQRGKGEPCPLRGSVGLWSRVKVKPLRGRPDGANLDTSKRRDSRWGYGGLPPSQREGAQQPRGSRCGFVMGGVRPPISTQSRDGSYTSSFSALGGVNLSRRSRLEDVAGGADPPAYTEAGKMRKKPQLLTSKAPRKASRISPKMGAFIQKQRGASKNPHKIRACG